jgi:selenocysteine lyase/cysteine desulfurase
MIKCQKHLFNLDSSEYYLNCAYKSPLLKKGELLAINSIKNERTPSYLKPNNYFEISEQIRNEFSRIIKSHKDEVAIMPSSSYGFANVFNNINFKGNKAIVVENEFPSGYFSVKKWCKEYNVQLEVIKRNKLSAEDWNKKIINSIDSNTSVVLISSIHWMNGTKFDLKKIGEKCKISNTYFIVDGTQSVGAMSIDVKDFKIDALICAGYKWLFGPYSMALGYFSSKFSDGIPIEESWMNRTNAQEFSNLTEYDSKYKPKAGRYNVGETANFILSPIMLNGLNQINSWGINNIESYCNKLSEIVINELSPLGIAFENENYFTSHLFSLGLPDHLNLLSFKNILEEKKIRVSVRGSNLRVSINVFNDENDINKLVETVKEFI